MTGRRARRAPVGAAGQADVTIEIDALVLYSFRHGDAMTVAEGLTNELRRQVSEEGIPFISIGDASSESLSAADAVQTGSPTDVGVAIARSVHAALTPRQSRSVFDSERQDTVRSERVEGSASGDVGWT